MTFTHHVSPSNHLKTAFMLHNEKKSQFASWRNVLCKLPKANSIEPNMPASNLQAVQVFMLFANHQYFWNARKA